MRVSWGGGCAITIKVRNQRPAGPPPIETILIGSILRLSGALSVADALSACSRSAIRVNAWGYGDLGVRAPDVTVPGGESAPGRAVPGVHRHAGAPPRPPLLRARPRQGPVPVRRQRRALGWAAPPASRRRP